MTLINVDVSIFMSEEWYKYLREYQGDVAVESVADAPIVFENA